MRKVIERPTKWFTHKFVTRIFDVHVTYIEGDEGDILAHFTRYVTLLSKRSVNKQNVTLTVRATHLELRESIKELGEIFIVAYEEQTQKQTKKWNRHDGQNELAQAAD